MVDLRQSVNVRRWLIPAGLSVVTLLFYRWCGLWPLQRYPNWDWAWGDARAANSLAALRRNLGSGQLPALDLRTNLGFDYVGDIYPMINPLNLLIGIMRPATVIWVRSAVMVVLGTCGVYFWLSRWARTSLAVAGALLYLSLPYLTSLSLFTTMGMAPFVLPILLIATEDLVERVSWRSACRAWLAIAVSVLAGDVNILLSIAPILVVYGGVYGLVVRGLPWRDVLRALGVAGATAFGAAAPLLLPLRANSQSIQASQAMASFLPGPRSGVDVTSFLKANGGATLIWPFEGSGLLLYCPAVFVLLGAVGLIIRGPRLAADHRRRGLALLLVAAAFVVETFVVNNTFLLRALGVSDPGARGVLRYHLNVLPYLLLLIGVLGCARLAARMASVRPRWPVAVVTCTLAASVAIDVLVLVVDPTWSGRPLEISETANVPSPTLLRLPQSWNPISLIAGLHVLAALVLLVTALPRRVVSRRGLNSSALLSAVAVLVTFGTVTANMEMLSRSLAQWHWVTDSTYRLDSFRERRSCVERTAPVNDPGARVLYTASESLSVGTGRDWANLLELELAQGSGQHPLFSFRELDVPIVGVYYGFFGIVQSSLLFPPKAAVVARRASLLRLLGVRYVVSSHATLTDSGIASQDFTLLGVCAVHQGPTEIRGQKFDQAVASPLSGAGLSYVYEVRRSPGIFFLACANSVMSQEEALRQASRLSDTAWEKGVVWTEKALPNSASMECSGQPLSSRVQVRSENGSDVHLQVEADRPLALVASYAFRPGWSASVDGHGTPVLRAYGGLMAIAIPEGSHTVVFKYRSASFPLGLAVFALSAVVLWAGSRRSRRRVSEPAAVHVDLEDAESPPAHDQMAID